jgi:hypothetical protein
LLIDQGHLSRIPPKAVDQQPSMICGTEARIVQIQLRLERSFFVRFGEPFYQAVCLPKSSRDRLHAFQGEY